jgi:hypothetical protein
MESIALIDPARAGPVFDTVNAQSTIPPTKAAAYEAECAHQSAMKRGNALLVNP